MSYAVVVISPIRGKQLGEVQDSKLIDLLI